MKNAKICPKCGSDEILRVGGHMGSYGQGNSLWLGSTPFSTIELPRYICCQCGYAEEWVNSRDLIRLREYREKQLKK